VKFASIVEMLNVPSAMARTAAAAKVSNQSPQTFRESLLATSKASSDTGSVSDGGARAGRHQKSVSEDAKEPGTVSPVGTVLLPTPPQQRASQQVPLAQRARFINPALTPMHPPLARSVASLDPSMVAAGQPMRDAAAARSSGVEPNTARPAVVKSESVRSSHAQSDSDPQAASILPSPEIHSTNASVAPVSQTATNVSNTVSNAAANELSSTIPSSPSVATLSAAANVVANTVQDSIADLGLPAISNAPLNPETVPLLHAALNASAKGDVAPTSSLASTDQADPPVVAPDPSGFATDLGVPDATANQLVALIQPGGGLLVQSHASLGSAAVAKPLAIAGPNGNPGANNAVNDTTGLKQHAPSASDHAGSQTGSQDTASSGDQSQGGASPLGQSAAPAQMSFANHTITSFDQAQNTGLASPLQTASVPGGIAVHNAKTQDTAAPASIALPQTLPVINTAKLIQNMGQTEMRVGMRSNEFGNISISTSATRDLISAQISLDHSGLARTLAIHLPEMQARLGGNQAMEVRIDMNGQGVGTSAGMTNGSADQSHGERQQKGSTASSRSANGVAEQGHSIAAAAMLTGEARLNARLDITA
jgi:hypothetical protein